MSSIIKIENLTKFYKGEKNPAVDNLSLSVEDGSFFGFLGPNGAGKTTTISILCNQLNATSGRIEINNFLKQNIEDNGNFVQTQNRKEIAQSIGIVPQEISLYGELSARENLRFFGGLYGLEKSVLEERIEAGLERVGLKESGKKQINHFSGGMKRRINLLAGVLHKPKLLFLDEPTVGVDVQSRGVILDFLQEINRDGTTIIYTSHFLEEAEKICSDIAIIDYGKIICKGKKESIIENHPDCKSLEEIFLKLTGRKLRD